MMSDLTVSAVAKELRVRRSLVVKFLESGQLAGYDITAPSARRKSYRITRQSLDDFKSGRPAKAPPSAKTRYTMKKSATVREFF